MGLVVVTHGHTELLLCGMWGPPRPEVESVSPALTRGFLITGPLGKSLSPSYLLSGLGERPQGIRGSWHVFQNWSAPMIPHKWCLGKDTPESGPDWPGCWGDVETGMELTRLAGWGALTREA